MCGSERESLGAREIELARKSVWERESVWELERVRGRESACE